MSAPNQGKNSSINNQPGAGPARPTVPRVPPALESHDIIPIPLLIGIFACVGALAWFILADNWSADMTRYNSIRAQETRQWQKAINNLEELREAGRTKGDRSQEFSPTYLSELAYSYLGLENYEKSLEFYKLAQQYRTNLPTDDSGAARATVDFNSMIGYVYFKMGNLAEADKAMQEALKFNKLDPRANFILGEIAMKRNDYIKAADYFKVVANNPDYEKQVQSYYAQIEKQMFAGIS